MNGQKNQIKVPNPAPQLTEATVQRMLAVQEQKLALELKQTELSLREIDHNQKIADKSIQAQAEDRKDERKSDIRMNLHRLIFAGIVVALIIAFVIAALLMNKDAIVLDLVKVVLGFVGGWGASNAFGSKKTQTSTDDSSKDE